MDVELIVFWQFLVKGNLRFFGLLETFDLVADFVDLDVTLL
jgi:hypothetical protein